MSPESFGGVRSALAWLVFPLVPAILGDAYYQAVQSELGKADPRDWGWLTWILLTGPLLGYGFLAGATLDLPDEPSHRGIGGWLSRRSLWVAAGPWVGFLSGAVLVIALRFVISTFPGCRDWTGPPLSFWQETWTGWLFGRALVFGGIGSIAFGWLLVARMALRRARRSDQLRRSIGRGLALALGFLGSLFGSFWAITEAWRAYFFDPRVVPILLAAPGLALLVGCAQTVTYGEVRRRELFQAMLMAWLLGMALAWRWWSRPRPKPPGH